jgi:hypothetical protein
MTQHPCSPRQHLLRVHDQQMVRDAAAPIGSSVRLRVPRPEVTKEAWQPGLMQESSSEQQRLPSRRWAIGQLVLMSVGFLAPICAAASVRLGDGIEQWWISNVLSAAAVVGATVLFAVLWPWVRPLALGLVVGSMIAVLFVVPLTGYDTCPDQRVADGHKICNV